MPHCRDLLPTLKKADILRIDRGTIHHYVLYSGNGKVIHLTTAPNRSGFFSSCSSNSYSNSTSCSGSRSSQSSNSTSGSGSGSSQSSNSGYVSGSDGFVSEENLITVAGNDYVEIDNLGMNYDREDKVIERARKRLGPHKYDVASYNCEHFVNEIKYGIYMSKQIDKAATTMTVSTVGATAVAAVVSPITLPSTLSIGPAGNRDSATVPPSPIKVYNPPKSTTAPLRKIAMSTPKVNKCRVFLFIATLITLMAVAIAFFFFQPFNLFGDKDEL